MPCAVTRRPGGRRSLRLGRPERGLSLAAGRQGRRRLLGGGGRPLARRQGEAHAARREVGGRRWRRRRDAEHRRLSLLTTIAGRSRRPPCCCAGGAPTALVMKRMVSACCRIDAVGLRPRSLVHAVALLAEVAGCWCADGHRAVVAVGRPRTSMRPARMVIAFLVTTTLPLKTTLAGLEQVDAAGLVGLDVQRLEAVGPRLGERGAVTRPPPPGRGEV